MANDSIVIRRLKQLAEVTDDELEATGDTLELEQMDLMETSELKRLLGPDAEQDDGSE